MRILLHTENGTKVFDGEVHITIDPPAIELRGAGEPECLDLESSAVAVWADLLYRYWNHSASFNDAQKVSRLEEKPDEFSMYGRHCAMTVSVQGVAYAFSPTKLISAAQEMHKREIEREENLQRLREKAGRLAGAMREAIYDRANSLCFTMRNLANARAAQRRMGLYIGDLVRFSEEVRYLGDLQELLNDISPEWSKLMEAAAIQDNHSVVNPPFEEEEDEKKCSLVVEQRNQIASIIGLNDA